MARIILACLILVFSAVVLSAQTETVKVWPEGPPGAKENLNYREETRMDQGKPRVARVTDPVLLVYLPAPEKANGSAVVICPGGGYGLLAIDHEGYDIAAWLNQMGIAGIVLKYRLPSDAIMENKSVGPLQDTQEAIRIVRRRAGEWRINPSRIGIMGFSAGGHLASTASTHFADPVYKPVDSTSARPDFAILLYPVISLQPPNVHMGSRNNLLGPNPSQELVESFSNELRVTPETPPTFLVHSEDDNGVPVGNSISYFQALVKNKVPAELHVYQKGGHGYGLAKGRGTESAWPEACQAWLKQLGMLAPASVAVISGELKQWHKVTLTLDGPGASETDNSPNPFLDYRMTVRFAHGSGGAAYLVPGYFAADGEAADSHAVSGNKWRVHFSPDRPGKWTYSVEFAKGKNVAVEKVTGEKVTGCNGLEGSFSIAETDKSGRDFRGKGTLRYVGKHHLQFAGTGEYFLKAGADAPENLLAYEDFDGTFSHKPNAPARPGEAAPPSKLHRWDGHASDWKNGDPTWAGGKGKNLIGALDYLAGKGVNAFSFLTYNVGGDGDDVWPMAGPEDKLHYDCSKLDQWQIVFDHAQTVGLYLHFKMEETENDDNRTREGPAVVPAALDGGDLGVERKLYCRELIARFGHELALNWNLGEENTMTPEQQRAMAQYIRELDPYGHNIVIHTYPDWQDRVYSKLVGNQSVLTGASLQNDWDQTHQRTRKWVQESARNGRPWVCANDEQGPADLGAPPDPGYEGFTGKAKQKDGRVYDLHDIRKYTLWGNLMAGGAGVEYYFGYTLPQNDLRCEDWRSRDRSWDFARIALSFFNDNRVPFWEMKNADESVGNLQADNSRYCLAKPGAVYVVYLPAGGTTELDLSGESGDFGVQWFNPRKGGPLTTGSVQQVKGGSRVSIGPAPSEPGEDWCVLVTRK